MSVVSLNKTETNIVLTQLALRAGAEGKTANGLYGKVMEGWIRRASRSYATFDLADDEYAIVRDLLPERRL